MNEFRAKVAALADEMAEQDREEKAERPKKVEKKAVESGFVSTLKKLFAEGAVSKEVATAMLPYLIFLSVLGMVYIANSHMAVKNIRAIDKLSKEVKELSWEYKSLKADLMFKSKMTEVAKKVDTIGLKELIEPPKKIIVER